MIRYQKIKFEDNDILSRLNPIVKEWFLKKFKHFSPPQKYAVVNIHNRENTLISSPTGTGKTLSAFMTIISELTDLSEKDLLEDQVYCIYISPLKALGNDINRNLNSPLEEIKELAKKQNKKIDFRIGVRTGDTTASKKQAMTKKPPHILITTPESFAIMLLAPVFRKKLENVQWVIVDEIHALADNKRGVHLSLSLEFLNKITNFTRIGLSASISPLKDVAKFLVGVEDYRLDENSKYRSCKIVDVQSVKTYDVKVLSPVRNLILESYNKIYLETYKLLDNLIQSHNTTLIFTNTRSATERVVHHLKEKFPKNYSNYEEGNLNNLAAHHGSLSKSNRLNTESRLKKGDLKAVVSSTSLELGIDIGSIDMVILLGSPKSVARGLQRIGRSGHKLNDVARGRILILNRDDLIECSVLLKSIIERNIDKIHIPFNSLDVLAQQIFGAANIGIISKKELFETIKKSYCYHRLDKKDFDNVISFLKGDFAELEDRYVYAKIWYDEETGMIGKKGKLARVLYMTNVGTIPDETNIKVKLGDELIGFIAEPFLERLKKGDVFVLGGQSFEYKYTRGSTAVVTSGLGKPPTVPSWFSEMLPLSFDLAMNIQKFRLLMNQKLEANKKKSEIIDFIHDYLYVDANSSNSIYEFFRQQYLFSEIPNSKKILIEYFNQDNMKYVVFHTLFGRRVNDVISRAIGYAISKVSHADVEININDNGFFIRTDKRLQIMRAINSIQSKDFRKLMEIVIDSSEILSRRFRHCAARSLMILRNYKGRTKSVGRQQMSSRLLLSAVKRISNDFPVLKEAKREILEDVMDIENAIKVFEWIEEGQIKIVEKYLDGPSPFSFELITSGYSDLIKMEDKQEFLQRMHQLVLNKISKNPDKNIVDNIDVMKYAHEKFIKTQTSQPLEIKKENMLKQAELTKMPKQYKLILLGLINENIKYEDVPEDFFNAIKTHSLYIRRNTPTPLKDFVLSLIKEDFSYDKFWDDQEQKHDDDKQKQDEVLIKHLMIGARKDKVDSKIIRDIINAIEDNIKSKSKLKDETLVWIKELFSKPIKKHWKDDIVLWLKKFS